MMDLRLITNEEIAHFINSNASTDIKHDSLSRRGLEMALDSLKQNPPKGTPIDAYYKIVAQLTRLREFKEQQESQLKRFKQVLVKY